MQGRADKRNRQGLFCFTVPAVEADLDRAPKEKARLILLSVRVSQPMRCGRDFVIPPWTDRADRQVQFHAAAFTATPGGSSHGVGRVRDTAACRRLLFRCFPWRKPNGAAVPVRRRPRIVMGLAKGEYAVLVKIIAERLLSSSNAGFFGSPQQRESHRRRL